MTGPDDEPSAFRAVRVTISREWLSHRVNRFLHWHLGLLAVAGVSAVLAAPKDEAGGVAWFILYAVLYVVSLSSVLLGLSSAQAEADETPFLLTQPTGVAPWVVGKAIGLATIVAPSAVLLVLPWWLTSGWSTPLALLAVATAALCVLLAITGLAVGLWVRDPVRGLIAAIAGWFLALFATDVWLILVAGSPWMHEHPWAWVGPLMLNPFDALRVTVLLAVERSAFNTLGSGALVGWWTAHTGAWLSACFGGWIAVATTLALGGARHRRRG
jgi:ABC-2 type transport system permease protein/Cu-processing system permease protein